MLHTFQNVCKSSIRLLFFRESGYEERTPLFDSSIIKDLYHNTCDAKENPSVSTQFTDMVFGSLALRCQETYFRIHSLSSPDRIIFTQVFPIIGARKTRYYPEHSHLPSCSTNNNITYFGGTASSSSIEDSSHYFELGNSNLQLGSQSSVKQGNVSNSSTSTIDSGYSSFTISSRNSLSSGASFNSDQSKLRKTETNICLSDSNIFTREYTETNFNVKTSSKFGLVIILKINSDTEEYYEYYMRHVAFIEMVLYRIRKNIEFVFNNSETLMSKMTEIFLNSTHWLERMLPKLAECDNYEISKRYCQRTDSDSHKLNLFYLMAKTRYLKFLIGHSRVFSKGQTIKTSTNYFNEFCELLKKLENKETNFFISTIVTATLTYHLGWISTCHPYKDVLLQPEISSYNSLWIQIAELYGARGYPIKSAQTVINGLNGKEIITKILHFIFYFIRYSTVTSNFLNRINVNEDNKTADMICLNYKTQNGRKKSTLNKSTASFNLAEFSEETYNYEEPCPPKGNVTFLLGENEKLVNIKPKYMSNIVNIKSSKKSSSTYNPRTMEIIVSNIHTKSDMIKHSNSLSMLDGLLKSGEQNSKFNKLAESEPPRIQQQTICDIAINNVDLSINETIPISLVSNGPENSYFSSIEEKNKNQTVNTKPRNGFTKMKILLFPLPTSQIDNVFKTSFTSTLKSDIVANYAPDLAVQGTSIHQKEILSKLKRDLYLTRQIYFFDGHVDESIAVVGNIDEWNVQVISSRYSISQNTLAVRLDTSSLVANMLEVLLQMWDAQFGKKYCATYIEQRLMEICIRSYALSQLLIHSNVCTINLLTATLHIEISDLPLLMSAASIIAPQVTKKYGLSYQ